MKRLWYFKLLLLCSICSCVQGQISWNKLPLSENAQDRIKNTWKNAIDGVKEIDGMTGQNIAGNVEQIAENAGISFSESPSPSPTMTPTPSVTPSSSPSPSETPSSSPSETPTPSNTPTPTATPTPTKSASSTPFRKGRSASPTPFRKIQSRSSSPNPSFVEVTSLFETPTKSSIPTQKTSASATPFKNEVSASPTPFQSMKSVSHSPNPTFAVVTSSPETPSASSIPSGTNSASPTPFRNGISASPTLSTSVQSVSSSPSPTFVAVTSPSETPVASSTPTQTEKASPTPFTNIQSVSPSPSGAFVIVSRTSEQIDVPTDGTEITVNFEPILSDQEEEELYEPPSVGDRTVIQNFLIDGDFSGEIAPTSRQMFQERVLGKKIIRQSIGLPAQVKVLANGVAIVLRRSVSCTGSLLPVEAPQKVELELVQVYDDKAGVKVVFTAEGPFGNACRILISFEVTTVRKLREGVPLPSLSPIVAPSRSPSVNVSTSAAPPTPNPTPSPSPTVSPFTGVPENQHGMSCTRHPAYFDGLKGVLLRSWKSIGRRDRYSNSVYRPRWTERVYAPMSNLNSKKYENLDFMQFAGVWNHNESQILYLRFTRLAIVYLFLRAWDRDYEEMTFEDWTPEGWATAKDGNTEKINLSIQREVYFHPSRYAYVFSKRTDNDEIILPGGGYINRTAVGSRSWPHYWLLFAEEDGSASIEPLLPPGVNSITPGLRCPDSLHNLWVAPARTEEPDVADEKFETVHPLWDPCYWCAYSHEHGSIPFDAMSWYPRLDYVSFKNNETESREGHKGYMIRTGDYLFYYGMHAHVSQSRRFFTRFRTVIFVVVDANTKEKLLELSYKGDFGFLGARPPPHGRGSAIPVNIEDAAILDDIIKSPIPTARRLIRLANVNDPRNRDPIFGYRNSTNLLANFYEKWITFPMCSDGNGFVEVDIQNPATALKEKGGSSEMTKLGVPQDDNPYEVKFQNPSNRRLIRAFGFNFSADFCNFEMPDSTGVFYTSPDGLTLKPGPGRGNVRQYIKPGFTLSLRGKYRPNDTFVGMHFDNDDGFNSFRDIGRAVDPTIN